MSNAKQDKPDEKSQVDHGFKTNDADPAVVDRSPLPVIVTDAKDHVWEEPQNGEIADALGKGKLADAVRSVLAEIDSLPSGGRLDYRINSIREKLYAALVDPK